MLINSSLIKKCPIYIGVSFLIFTEVFFFLGPIDYHPISPIILILFLFIVNLCLYHGYKTGLRSYKLDVVKVAIDHPKTIKWVNSILLFSILWTPIRLHVGWSLDSFAPSTYVHHFLFGWANLNEAYDTTMHLSGGTLLSSLCVLASPIVSVSVPFGVYYYKKLKLPYKFVVVLLLLIEVIFCIGLGQRKKILDVIIISFFCYLAQRGIKPLRLGSFLIVMIISILAIGFFLYYFLYSSISRSGIEDITGFSFKYSIKPWYVINTSADFYYSLAQIHTYLCHAYENLSFALDHFFSPRIDYIWSFGMGNNSFTINMPKQYLGVDISPYTYQYVLSQYYHRQIGLEWMTIYPWIANDFTFLGVPFIVYGIGRFFAKLWLDILYRSNIYSVPLFTFVAVTVFYSFANNQAVSASFIPVIVVLFLYFYNKRKYVRFTVHR